MSPRRPRRVPKLPVSLQNSVYCGDAVPAANRGVVLKGRRGSLGVGVRGAKGLRNANQWLIGFDRPRFGVRIGCIRLVHSSSSSIAGDHS